MFSAAMPIWIDVVKSLNDVIQKACENRTTEVEVSSEWNGTMSILADRHIRYKLPVVI